jgi:exopolysaccharide biosynthesis polyprenyl glycosylphosphotransferase
MKSTVTAGAAVTAATRPGRDWHAKYSSRLVLTDLIVLTWVVFGVQIAWFGFATADVTFRGNAQDLAVSYTTVSVLVIASWMALLHIFGTREHRVLGTGPQEYKLIAGASIRLFGLIAIAAYLLHIDVARGYVILAFPLGFVVLVFSRWMWRQWLVSQRLAGKYSSRVILIGSAASATHIATELARQPGAGYLVVGACVVDAASNDHLSVGQIPILGTIDDLHAALELQNADTVVVTSSDDISPSRMRELSWSLEPGRHHLVVVPRLVDVAGPRIQTRPVAGLPLIHIETPRYEGRMLYAKRAFDITASIVLLLVLSPVFLVTAIAIRLGSPGALIFRQPRIGINGNQFTMFKFRSMVPNAEEKLQDLQVGDRAAGNSVLFKMKNDPRVTPVGRLLRRLSIDELPQLVNVLNGTMSLVGPRPPLQSELKAYEVHVHRRFLVKPGITGLWQVSGRSNLSWEDSVRLDLYYVENWSIAGDLTILWRTARAVLAQVGAY